MFFFIIMLLFSYQFMCSAVLIQFQRNQTSASPQSSKQDAVCAERD